MPARIRLATLACAAAATSLAEPPPALGNALDYLRSQKSYTWEIINADPGPVAQRFRTRRGRVTVVQQNTAPHVLGSIDQRGDTLVQRQWSDGLQLDTIITADGAMVTRTPEGWMTPQEVLTELANERMRAETNRPRLQWLQRADRPDVRRPDQELPPLLATATDFQELDDRFVAKGRIYPGGDPESGPPIDVEVTVNLNRGVIRDYEVKVAGTRKVSRARVEVPITDQRIVILTYLPVSRIDIPEEARLKLDEG